MIHTSQVQVLPGHHCKVALGNFYLPVHLCVLSWSSISSINQSINQVA